jgi:polyvinyl alcohol dehydrogenase (cytochrome)
MRPRALAVLLIIAAAAGCTSGAATASPSRAASSPSPTASHGGSRGPAASWWRSVPATDWQMYHANPQRTGAVAGLPAARNLAVAWSARLDGAVYGQPLALGGIVIAATENDSVYGLDRSTGHVRWHTRVGTPLPLAAQPCGNIDPLGITGTPVYDRAAGLVFVLAQSGRTRHVLVGLRVADGTVRYRRNVPSPDRQPYYDQQRAALAAGHGRIYVAFGGHYGDCGPYVGSVVAMPDSGGAAPVSYLVPSHHDAGIWAPAGPVISPGGTVYVAVGNGDTTGRYDGSDSVTALSGSLRRTGVFAPGGWQAENAADLDLGSMSPALLADGSIVQAGKRGTAYLLRAGHLGGVGAKVPQRQVCGAYGGAAVAGQTVYLPCADGGIAAVRVAAGRMTVRWRGPNGAAGSPVTGGGAVWVADYSAGILFELAPATGHVRHQLRLGTALPHFASPSLTGGLALIGTLHGAIAVAGA